MRNFIHTIKEMIDSVVTQTRECINAQQINELYMLFEYEGQEEVKSEEPSITPGNDTNLALSMNEVSDEFIRTLAS